MRGQKVYRALLILPYAIPGFISLLLWSSFYNQDFGLINDITGLNINWFGDTTTAKFAVLLTNLWMGFPYMFLVATGALQAIPEDLTEAAKIDGAERVHGVPQDHLPAAAGDGGPAAGGHLRLQLQQLRAIYLLTRGGPFSPDNPTAGGTDILHQLHLPPGLRGRRRADRLRLRGVGRPLHHHRRRSRPCSSAPRAHSRR